MGKPWAFYLDLILDVILPLSIVPYCHLIKSKQWMQTHNQLERLPQLATRLARGLRHVLYEERFHQFNLFSLECIRLRGDLILAFNIFKREVDFNPSDFFLRPPWTGLRGNTYQLLQVTSHLRLSSGAFSVRIAKFWNRLPAHIVLSPSLSIFRKQLDRHWSKIFPAAPV